jgi:hypothetical protein
MLNTYIQNRGITKTIIHNNNEHYLNEMKWDADYDGEIANLSLDINDNNKNQHIDLKLNNEELSELMNLPSVEKSIDKRLKSDFLLKKNYNEPKMIMIYQKPKNYIKKRVHFAEPLTESLVEPFIETISSSQIKPQEKKYTHISSPLPKEKYIYTSEIEKDLIGKPRSRATLRVSKKPKTWTFKNRRSSKSKTSYLRKKLKKQTL